MILVLIVITYTLLGGEKFFARNAFKSLDLVIEHVYH